MIFSLTSSLSHILDQVDITSAIFTTRSGVVTVLPGHEPLIAAVEPCVLEVTEMSGVTRRFAIGEGIAHIDPERVMILADTADDGSLIDPREIAERKAEIQKQIAELRTQHQHDRSVETMEGIINLETQFLRESALEMVAASK